MHKNTVMIKKSCPCFLILDTFSSLLNPFRGRIPNGTRTAFFESAPPPKRGTALRRDPARFQQRRLAHRTQTDRQLALLNLDLGRNSAMWAHIETQFTQVRSSHSQARRHKAWRPSEKPQAHSRTQPELRGGGSCAPRADGHRRPPALGPWGTPWKDYSTAVGDYFEGTPPWWSLRISSCVLHR